MGESLTLFSIMSVSHSCNSFLDQSSIKLPLVVSSLNHVILSVLCIECLIQFLVHLYCFTIFFVSDYSHR